MPLPPTSTGRSLCLSNFVVRLRTAKALRRHVTHTAKIKGVLYKQTCFPLIRTCHCLKAFLESLLCLVVALHGSPLSATYDHPFHRQQCCHYNQTEFVYMLNRRFHLLSPTVLVFVRRMCIIATFQTVFLVLPPFTSEVLSWASFLSGSLGERREWYQFSMGYFLFYFAKWFLKDLDTNCGACV